LLLELLFGLGLLALACLLREGQLFDLLKTSCMHVDHALSVLLLICWGTCLGRCRESHLAGVNEVPALVLVIVLRLQPLLAQIAEIVGGNVRL